MNSGFRVESRIFISRPFRLVPIGGTNLFIIEAPHHFTFFERTINYSGFTDGEGRQVKVIGHRQAEGTFLNQSEK